MATIKHVFLNISVVYGLIGLIFSMVVAINLSQHLLGALSENMLIVHL